MERRYYHYCYVVEDTTNGMKYFGVRTSEVDPKKDTKYMGSGSKITAAMKEKGRDQFKKEILEVFDTREDAMEYEEWYMAEHDCVDNPEYYNLSARSTGGRFDYHEDLKDGNTMSPQERNGPQTEASVLKSKIKRGEKKIAARAEIDAVKDAERAERREQRLAAEQQKKETMTDFEISDKHMSKAAIDRHYADNVDGSPDGRINHHGQMGGKRPGAGRPKGKAIYSRKSVEKLMDLGIDPIEELVRTYAQVCQDIEETRSISARTSLYNTRQKIMSDLMKYGYQMIPREDKREIAVEKKGPMSIILTDEDVVPVPSEQAEETKH